MLNLDFLLSRRPFLIGCSAAASPLLTPISFAAAPGQNRLVVIVLRGAMDGLDLLRPVGDRDYAGLRPTLAKGADSDPLDLDGFFALHPGCATLMPLWRKGQLGFAHATATPYKQRSHFVGQDFLENGGDEEDGELTRAGDGWLNRAVQRIPGFGPGGAVTVGREPMRILDGDAPTRHWLPVIESHLSTQGEALLTRLHRADPMFANSFDQALRLRKETLGQKIPVGSERNQLAAYVAGRLLEDARICAFSLNGWDTHQGQGVALTARLIDLSERILGLRDELGPHWDTTMVLCLTEFGRTARENGSGGTDHGTGGAVLMAGGAVRGGKVLGDWPGLSEAELYERRDLMPTRDVRSYAAWALRDLFGLAPADLQGGVFPSLDMGRDPKLTA